MWASWVVIYGEGAGLKSGSWTENKSVNKMIFKMTTKDNMNADANCHVFDTLHPSCSE